MKAAVFVCDMVGMTARKSLDNRFFQLNAGVRRNCRHKENALGSA